MTNYKDREFLKRSEVAALFGVTRCCIINWERKAYLKGLKLPNGRVIFRRTDVEALITCAGANHAQAH